MYAANTLKRQVNEYYSYDFSIDFADCSNNCIGLAKYFALDQNFAQALHFVDIGLEMVSVNQFPIETIILLLHKGMIYR
mgnify:FL=1